MRRRLRLQNHDSLVRPCAGLEKRSVGAGVYEDIVKDRVVRTSRGRVAHVDSGGEEDPFAILLRHFELACRSVGGAVVGRLRYRRLLFIVLRWREQEKKQERTEHGVLGETEIVLVGGLYECHRRIVLHSSQEWKDVLG